MLVTKDPLLRAHEGEMALAQISLNGLVLSCVAVPLSPTRRPVVGLALVREEKFTAEDIHRLHSARNFAQRVIEKLLPRNIAMHQQAISILGEAAEYLRRALMNYPDELERQNCLAIVVDKLYSLAPCMRVSPDFQDAVALLHVAARNAERRVLTQRQIQVFEQAVCNFQSLNFGADIVDRHWCALFEAGIDMDLPLRGISSSQQVRNGHE